MVSVGEEGYLEATREILAAADTIKAGIAAIPELAVVGDPLFCVAFVSDDLDVYRVLDAMSARGWSLNGLQRPPAGHICVTRRHAREGVAERFVADLGAAVADVRDQPASEAAWRPSTARRRRCRPRTWPGC